jgi:uncharacterized protein YdiU (UPF0061 family)
MFYSALRPLLIESADELTQLDQVRHGFAETMQKQVKKMWAAKLGLVTFDDELFKSLMSLMIRSKVDFTIFFRELSTIPEQIFVLKKSFYVETSQQLDDQWLAWLNLWRREVISQNNSELADISVKMKQTNPKYTWREWLVAPAYQQAMKGDYSLVRELQEVLSHPYDEQSREVEAKFYQLKPKAFFNAGGVSHYSCSS